MIGQLGWEKTDLIRALKHMMAMLLAMEQVVVKKLSVITEKGDQTQNPMLANIQLLNFPFHC